MFAWKNALNTYISQVESLVSLFWIEEGTHGGGDKMALSMFVARVTIIFLHEALI